jgi:hypothetical protein
MKKKVIIKNKPKKLIKKNKISQSNSKVKRAAKKLTKKVVKKAIKSTIKKIAKKKIKKIINKPKKLIKKNVKEIAKKNEEKKVRIEDSYRVIGKIYENNIKHENLDSSLLENILKKIIKSNKDSNQKKIIK